jgi:hypothetical protein
MQYKHYAEDKEFLPPLPEADILDEDPSVGNVKLQQYNCIGGPKAFENMIKSRLSKEGASDDIYFHTYTCILLFQIIVIFS